MHSLKITQIGYTNENPFKQVILMNRKMRKELGIKEGDFLKVKKGNIILFFPVMPQFKGTTINDITINYYGARLLDVAVNDTIEILDKINVSTIRAGLPPEIRDALGGEANDIPTPDDIIRGGDLPPSPSV